MTIAVRLFAKARDLAGTEIALLELPEGATVGQLRQALVARHTQLAPMLPTLLVALNNDYAPDTAILPARAEIACFPPVSGG